MDISNGATSTSSATDFVLTGKVDKYCGSIYDSNRNVKILKYYSGATLEGTVSLDGIGPVPNARILIERDAFSGEEIEVNGHVVDRDSSCLLYTSPSPRDGLLSRMPSSA